MSDIEKAKVISISGSGKKAEVVSVSGSESKVRVWVPTVGDPTPTDAADFVRRYREFAQLEPTYGFMAPDLERMVQASRVAPLRFVYERRTTTPNGNIGHWMLYVQTLEPTQVRVYDPILGLKNLTLKEEIHKFHDVMFDDPNIEAKWGPETVEQRGPVTITHKDLLNPRSESEYQIEETELSKLGPIQQNAYDCGPLCVYAGVVARKVGKIK